MGSILAYVFNVLLTSPNAVNSRKMFAGSLYLTASVHHYLLSMEELWYRKSGQKLLVQKLTRVVCFVPDRKSVV